ncbi:MAG: CRTAC1 family protein [Myxococcales bacterium]|nr:CRTAC1 family protein [Myxococcales bacterium]
MRDALARGALALAVCGGCEGSDVTDPYADVELVPVRLESSGPKVCAQPDAREVLGPFERRTRPLPDISDLWTWAGGVTLADLNQDGWLDTLACVEPGLELYAGSPDQSFPSQGEVVFGAFDLSFCSGVSVADYDGDGDLDVYVMRVRGAPIPESVEAEQPQLGANRLLRNDGDGRFVDVTDEAGVAACGEHHREGGRSCFRTMSSSWGDVDADGDLDLFVGNYGEVDETDGVTQEDMSPAEPSFLYLNDGDGTFTDASDQLPEELHDGYTYAGGFIDLDLDGDLDIYTVNDFGRVAPNTVLWNRDGVLTLDSDDRSGLIRAMTGMGLGVGDFNCDGWPDVAVPEWRNNFLLLSDPDLKIWVDHSDVANMVADARIDQAVGWGSVVGDIDNDRDLDIAVQYGFLPNANDVWTNPAAQPDALYLNQGTACEPSFVDAGDAWQVADPGSTRGAAMGDLNRDGWLDIAKRNLGNRPPSNDPGPAVVYLSRCGHEQSITVRLRQPGMNQYGVGARVTVFTRHRRQTQQLLSGGTGYASSGPMELHFGLGQSGIAERIEVVWPDGAVSVTDYVPAMQEITLHR